MEKESSQGYFLYLVLFLGLLNGFGPFVIDMYLPALPEMTHVFKTSASVIQLGLTFCMGGLAVGQVLLGPVSDRFGRKAVLLFSLFLNQSGFLLFSAFLKGLELPEVSSSPAPLQPTSIMGDNSPK